MAVPNNYIDKIKKDGDSRMISPAADMVRVDNDNFEGADLDEVLDEVAQAIGEASEGGYAPPAGGIPKTDLSQDVQTSLDKADTALQSFTETDPTVPSWAKQPTKPTYTAQEVGALPANTTIPTKTSDLENDSGFVTSTTMTTALAGKQDTLTFDDAPTAGSNNPVKSGGIKTALDNLLANLHIVNGEWYIGSTATGVSAQGPAGNVNITDASQLVTILVNDLTTGGAGNILSAEMGKVLKTAISTLIDSMGEYCFPNGRPTLSWEGEKVNVTQTLTDVTSNFSPSRVDKNGSLDITLTPVDNLHVFLTGDVTVEMGGTDITSTAWNESTGKVTIADVTDDVVITAKSSTYVQRGLVLHLDGKNGRSVAHRWDSLVNYNNSPLYFKLENCDESNSDYVAGNGTNSKGTAFSDSALTTPVTLLDVGAADGTIEAAVSHAEIASNGNLPIMHNALGSGWRICLTSWHNTSICGENENALTIGTALQNGEQNTELKTGTVLPNSVIQSTNGFFVSALFNSFKVNGTPTTLIDYTLQTTNSESKLSIFYRRTTNDQFAKYRLYALRVYSVQLTDAERAQNLAVDQKRFNL